MAFFTNQAILTHQAVMAMLRAAIDQADAIACPQCVVIVDARGEVLGEIRMNGSKPHSRLTAKAKAYTAASIGAPSASLPETVRAAVAAANNQMAGLPGGLPIKKDGALMGGIGVGSGTGDQDIAVGKAALAAIDADPID